MIQSQNFPTATFWRINFTVTCIISTITANILMHRTLVNSMYNNFLCMPGSILHLYCMFQFFVTYISARLSGLYVWRTNNKRVHKVLLFIFCIFFSHLKSKSDKPFLLWTLCNACDFDRLAKFSHPSALSRRFISGQVSNLSGDGNRASSLSKRVWTPITPGHAGSRFLPEAADRHLGVAATVCHWWHETTYGVTH